MDFEPPIQDLDTLLGRRRIRPPFLRPRPSLAMEFVYVVPRAEIFRAGTPQGFIPFGGEPSLAGFRATVREHGFFVERSYAERTPSLKQIIPYTLVVSAGRLLCMRRLDRGGEARLHGKLSIGVGGHIDPEDAKVSADLDPIATGTERELREELDVQGTYELSRVGLLNDDSNPVGAVHLGLIQVLQLHGTVRIREEGVLEGRLVERAELERQLGEGANFETWSAVLLARLDLLVPDLLSATP
jgi:predicted NUDIX family phosphoesterase